MKHCIVFDCYQTLLYKKGREKITHDFSLNILKKKISLPQIKKAYESIYNRYKLKNIKFENSLERKNFYIKYNKELFKIMGISISSSQALQLNGLLENSVWTVYPDVIKTLRYLKKNNISVGMIANWTNGLDKIIKGVGLFPYFDFIHSSYALGIKKPNPKIFKKSLKDIFSKFDKIYYVGDDYEIDILPAKKAGLTPILIDRDNKYADLTACSRIKNIEDIKKFINI